LNAETVDGFCICYR